MGASWDMAPWQGQCAGRATRRGLSRPSTTENPLFVTSETFVAPEDAFSLWCVGACANSTGRRSSLPVPEGGLDADWYVQRWLTFYRWLVDSVGASSARADKQSQELGEQHFCHC